MILPPRLLRAFKKSSAPCSKAFANLRSPAEMGSILDRERARADRSGQGFALLKFVPRDAPRKQTLASLAKILTGRLRCTDEAGWLEEGQVGVVLPCTDIAGARHLAHDIRRSFGEAVPPHCEIYCYPTESAPAANGHAHANSNGHTNGHTNGRADGNGHARANGHSNGRADDVLEAPRRRSKHTSFNRCRRSNGPSTSLARPSR